MRMSSVKAQLFSLCCAVGFGSLAPSAHAVSSAELYTSASYPYGRFEARVQFAGGDGVVGSFFLWKEGSEEAGVFWNELDFETVWARCDLLTNALYGDPETVNSQSAGTSGNWCSSFHTYAYEWTPDYLAWFIDGREVRRETGQHAAAFSTNNVPNGMRIHFNVWPGDSTFGGNFNPSILPLHQYINWVQYSSYSNGTFTLEWREDFGASTLPEGWTTGDWDSPKGLSTHAPANVAFIDGYAVLSMTADDATGSTGARPMDPEGGGPLVEPEPVTPVDPEPMPTAPTPTEPEPAGGAPGDEGTVPAPQPSTGAGGAAGTPVAPDPSGNVDVPPAPGSNEPAVPGTPPGGTADPIAPQPGPAPGVVAPAPDPSSVAGPETPSGTTTAPPPGGGPAAPTDASPVVTESDAASDGGGGCRMGPRHATSPWAWVALLVALSVSRIRRRG